MDDTPLLAFLISRQNNAKQFPLSKEELLPEEGKSG